MSPVKMKVAQGTSVSLVYGAFPNVSISVLVTNSGPGVVFNPHYAQTPEIRAGQCMLLSTYKEVVDGETRDYLSVTAKANTTIQAEFVVLPLAK
jgi:hypothetical protein